MSGSVPSVRTRPVDRLTELGWDDGWQQLAQRHSESGLRPARVVLQGRDAWRVDDGRRELAAQLRGRLRHDDPAHLPVTGDWVLVAGHGDESAVIDQVLERRTAMRRKVPGRRTDDQVVAANVDLVAVCAPADDVNVRRIERELTLVWESGASPVVVVTKCDVVDCPADVGEEVAAVAIGVPVVLASSYTGSGVEQLHALLTTGCTLAVVGPSGVGKSTLGNALLASDTLVTYEIREDGKGRHTTTTRQLVVLPRGGLLLDTPGMREVALWTSDEGLDAAFSDIEALAATCRFHDCVHDTEPGCAVTDAIETGELAAERLASWRKLARELAFLARRQDARLRSEERKKWARIHREARGRNRP